MSRWRENIEVRRLERMDARVERVLAGGPVWSDDETGWLMQDVHAALEREFGAIDSDACVTPDQMTLATGFWPAHGERAIDRGYDVSRKAEADRYYRARGREGLERAARIAARRAAADARAAIRGEERRYEEELEERALALEALDEVQAGEESAA